MPSLEQIIRPFVVDPTTPPVPYVTTENEPPPELVRLNIGIGNTKLSSIKGRVAPIIPAADDPVDPINNTLTATKATFSSSYSISVQYYRDQKLYEQGQAPDR